MAGEVRSPQTTPNRYSQPPVSGAPRDPFPSRMSDERSRFTSAPAAARELRHVRRDPHYLQNDPLERGVGRCAHGLNRDHLDKSPADARGRRFQIG